MKYPEPGCVFCAIVDGRAPAVILEDLGRVIIIRPLNPVVHDHVLVIPKLHVTDFADDPFTAGLTMEAASRFVRQSGFGQCNLITSRGAAATQTVGHLHLHLIPRREGDGVVLPWTGQQAVQR